MRLNSLLSFGVWIALLIVGPSGFAEEPSISHALAPSEAIKIENVESAPAVDRGTATFRFKVDAPAGTRFYISYQHQGVRGAASTNSIWEIAGANGADVELSLGYRPEFQGDRSVSVLDSSEARLEYRLNVKGCTNSPGHVTIVSAPIFRTATEERQVFLPKSSSDDFATTEDGTRRLLLAVPKVEGGEQKGPANPPTRVPRTELIVGLDKAAPHAEPDPLQQLLVRWGRQRDEVGTAHIRYRISRGGGGTLAPLSQARVNEILAAADLDNHPENFADAIRKMMSVDVREQSRMDKPWSEAEFYMLGLRTRDEIASSFIRIYDGEWDFDYDLHNNQISVHRAGESHAKRQTLRDFRLAPPQFGDNKPEIKLLPSGDAELTNGVGGKYSALWTASPSTGFIHGHSHAIEPGSDDPTSRVKFARDEFQFGAKTYPGRIVFPNLIVRTGFVSDKLTSLEMILIDSAEFNDSMQKSQLNLSAPAKAKVFLMKKDPVKPPKFLSLPKDVDDVAGFLHAQKFLPDETSGDAQ